MKKKIECEKCSVNVVYQENLCFSEKTNCDQNNKNTKFHSTTGPAVLLESAFTVIHQSIGSRKRCHVNKPLAWSAYLLSKTFWEVVAVKFYSTVGSNFLYWQFKKTDGLLVYDVKLSLNAQRFDDAIQIKYVISQMRLPCILSIRPYWLSVDCFPSL